MTARRSLTVATLNLNGLRSATRHGYARWLRRKTPVVDVVCLQETRIQQHEIGAGLRAPRGWSTCHHDAKKKGYAGTAVWSAHPFDRVSLGTGLDWSDDEGRFTRVEIGDVVIVSVYAPSGSAGPERQARKDRFMEHFLPITQALMNEGRPTVLCGDFNVAHRPIDIHNPKGNAKNSGFLPHERAWLDALVAQGWVDVFRALRPADQVYSWWSARGRARELDRGWRLDHQWASPSLADRALEAWIDRKPKLSDHAPVCVRYDWPR